MHRCHALADRIELDFGLARKSGIQIILENSKLSRGQDQRAFCRIANRAAAVWLALINDQIGIVAMPADQQQVDRRSGTGLLLNIWKIKSVTQMLHQIDPVVMISAQ
jgi:hypothetical protein